MLHVTVNNFKLFIVSLQTTQKFAGRSTAFQWPSSQMNGLGTIGQNSLGLANAGSSGTSQLGRAGLVGSTGFNSAGSSGTSLIKTSAFGAGTRVSDQQSLSKNFFFLIFSFTPCVVTNCGGSMTLLILLFVCFFVPAQITQHLRELQRYAKTD